MTEFCYRHGDRETGLHCTRCGNPACADCLVPAPVGQHCRACVDEARSDMRKVRRVTWSAPGRSSGLGVVTRVLLVANALIYVVSASDPSLVGRFAFNRAAIVDGEYYRLITSAFLHANLTHLLANMLTLFFVGSQLEAFIGRTRFSVVYLVAGVGAAAATLLFGPAASVGASGALFGAIGALLATAHMRRLDTSSIVAITAVNLLLGFVIPGINYVAHLGGLATGLVVGAGLEWARSRRRQLAWESLVIALAAAVVVVAIVAGSGWRDTDVPDGRRFGGVSSYRLD